MVVPGLSSCDHQTVYHHYEHVSLGGWEKNDALHFAIPPVRTTGTYSEQLELRIDQTFPFLSLTMIVKQTVFREGLPTGATRHYRVIGQLAKSDGTMTGSGISYYQYSFPVTETVLEAGDSLDIEIVHNMKREIMPGITDVGFCLRRCEGK